MFLDKANKQFNISVQYSDKKKIQAVTKTLNGISNCLFSFIATIVIENGKKGSETKHIVPHHDYSG